MYEKRLLTIFGMNSEKQWDTLEAKKYLSKTLKMVGFQYKRCKTDRKILMERSVVVAHRIRFLRHIKSLGMQAIRSSTLMKHTFILCIL